MASSSNLPCVNRSSLRSFTAVTSAVSLTTKETEEPDPVLINLTSSASDSSEDTIIYDPYRPIKTEGRAKSTSSNCSSLLCDLCITIYRGNCPVHGPILFVPDRKVTPQTFVQDWALSSMPPGLCVQRSEIWEAELGVLALTDFPERAVFGPLQGDIVLDPERPCSNKRLWKLCLLGTSPVYVDGQSPLTANWMRFVNFARTMSERNLRAVQFQGQIFYMACKPIPSGTELLVARDENAGSHPFKTPTELARDRNASSYLFKIPPQLTRERNANLRPTRTPAVVARDENANARPFETPAEPATDEDAISHPSETPAEPATDEDAISHPFETPAEPATDEVISHPFETPAEPARDEEAVFHSFETPEKLPAFTKPTSYDVAMSQMDEADCQSYRSKPVPGEDSQKPAWDSQGPTEASQESDRDIQGPDWDSQGPDWDSQKPHWDSQRAAEDRQEPDWESPKPTWDSQEPAWDIQKPTWDSQRPAGASPETYSLCPSMEYSPSKPGTEVTLKDCRARSRKSGQGEFSSSETSERNSLCYSVASTAVFFTTGSAREPSQRGAGESGLRGVQLVDSSRSNPPPSADSELSDCGSSDVAMLGSVELEDLEVEPCQEDASLRRDVRAQQGEVFRLKLARTATWVKEETARAEARREEEQGKSEEQEERREQGKVESCSSSKDSESSTSGKKKNTCTECGKCFKHSSDLRTHFRSHTGEKPFRCETCGACFGACSSFRRHERIHKKYDLIHHCKVCDKPYGRLDLLRKHEICHRSYKPHECLECHRRFHTASDLQQHMRTHTQERPFLCKHCGKCFTRLTILKHHILIHTGEKPFKCPQCKRKFRLSHHLKRHLATCYDY